jgi:hypothetical protein
MNMTESIGATAIAERSLAAFQDPEYQRAVSRQVRLCGFGFLFGFLGIAVSLWQLRSGVSLSAQASQFWILCFVLAGGIACVTLVISSGMLVEQFAVSRLAIASTKTNEFEAVQEAEQLRDRLFVLRDLMLEINPANLDKEELRILMEVCAQYGSNNAPKMETSWARIEPHWLNSGVSHSILERLKKALFGSSDEQDKDQKYAH